MKILLSIYLALVVTVFARANDTMTPERFRQLATMPGDTNALRPELASLPFWKYGKCSVAMNYQNGKVFKEDCIQTIKTVEGKYIVSSLDSKFYKQTMYSVTEYDEKASAIRLWGLFGNTLTQATMVFDLKKKISASTSTYADCVEISVGSSSTNEMSEHTLVYKSGTLFMTRDVKTIPLTVGETKGQ
jgi:hypothetical protein